MATSSQSIPLVGKNSTNIFSENITCYILSLILSTGRKNYRSIAREHGINYEAIYNSSKELDQTPILKEFLIQSVRDNLSNRPNQGKLIIDFTLIQKPFASCMIDSTYDLDGVGKRVNKGFSLGFAFWTNDLITIPLDFTYWYRKEDTVEWYKTKPELVIELIKRIKNLIPVTDVLLDGAFATKKIVNYLISSNIGYHIRCPRNRIIERTDGSKQQLQHCPELFMVRNQKYKTIKTFCLGVPCFITAQKRKGKDNTSEVVYIISSKDIPPKEQIKSYGSRWAAEKFFRTSKQSLGLRDCQSTNRSKQELHFYCVMAAYTLLHQQKNYSRRKSIEEVVTILRYQKTSPKFQCFIDSMLTSM